MDLGMGLDRGVLGLSELRGVLPHRRSRGLVVGDTVRQVSIKSDIVSSRRSLTLPDWLLLS